MLYQKPFLRRLEAGLRSILPRWGLPPSAKVRLLNVSENATFCVDDQANERKLVLRVHRPGYHTPDEIVSELAWIEALRSSGVVDTPAPVPAKDGALLCAFVESGHWRHVVAFEHMSGREPAPSDDLAPWFERLGAINARLHMHSRHWQKPDGFIRKSWNCETILGAAPYWGNWRAGLGLDAFGKVLLERTEALLCKGVCSYGVGPERFGLVHADLRLANLLVEGDRLGVIDFDDCGQSWLVFDFASAVSFHEHEPFIPAVRAAWAEGYRRVAPLAVEDERAIGMFLMLRRMQLTAWIASHSETPTAQQLGVPFTQGTVALAEAYLSKHC
jgi:Ser/Thr protein kinase RdoA (MazF antagonist)